MPLDYMAYSYLQEGQDGKAKEIVDFAATVRKTNPELGIQRSVCTGCDSRRALRSSAMTGPRRQLSPFPAVPHWSSFPFMEALIEYAHALGQAHTDHLNEARKAIERMRQTARCNHGCKIRLLQKTPRAANAGRLRLDCEGRRKKG